ncbi:trace amine-associated receptor 1-like [Solea solea]|uniref:trace amine-associated receptor 1-like n=1 Tax=Solea solea TaxID=90069 RepID=UPI00272A1185|nr:trace amine-associated receptor 1-like [Solea solea]
MEAPEETELCFPHINTSCRRMRRPYMETTLMYTVMSCIIVFTVILNLLVIISISHFRQLHTTTNLLLLSLAVSDFLMGLLEMPLHLHYQGCWLLGDQMCALNIFISFLFVSVSVGCMVLIAIDRYIAICDPMFYTTRVTLTRVKICVCLCWMFAGVHCIWILRDLLKQPDIFRTCYGECGVVVPFADGLVDLIATFLGPILIIAILYSRVFFVAVSQARAMRSHIAVVTVERSQTVKVKKSEIKAARTLGIVIIVFFLCSCPYYSFAIAAESGLIGGSTSGIEIWFLFLNSSLNPIIYVFFYLWFRKTIKYIVSLQILQPGSRDASVL